MPFLGRTQEGGPFTSYYEALANLGAEFVRFAPWFPYPFVVVTELDPPDCNATSPATNWNSTLSDGVTRDFMAAVCGEDAATGRCAHSVAAHAATMPVWLYKGAYPVPPGALNPDPWEYNTFDAYNRGSELVDESCADMAGYVGRYVEHYTRGGHHDSCGHWHGGGFTYNWSFVSILNEDEHGTGGQRYTRCFDAIRAVVEKLSPGVALAGPEEALGRAPPPPSAPAPAAAAPPPRAGALPGGVHSLLPRPGEPRGRARASHPLQPLCEPSKIRTPNLLRGRLPITARESGD